MRGVVGAVWVCCSKSESEGRGFGGACMKSAAFGGKVV